MTRYFQIPFPCEVCGPDDSLTAAPVTTAHPAAETSSYRDRREGANLSGCTATQSPSPMSWPGVLDTSGPPNSPSAGWVENGAATARLHSQFSPPRRAGAPSRLAPKLSAAVGRHVADPPALTSDVSAECDTAVVSLSVPATRAGMPGLTRGVLAHIEEAAHAHTFIWGGEPWSAGDTGSGGAGAYTNEQNARL